MSKDFERISKCRTKNPSCLFLYVTQHIQVAIFLPSKTCSKVKWSHSLPQSAVFPSSDSSSDTNRTECCHKSRARSHLSSLIWDALHNMVPFVPFKKLEKTWAFFTFLKLHKRYQIAQNITFRVEDVIIMIDNITRNIMRKIINVNENSGVKNGTLREPQHY